MLQEELDGIWKSALEQLKLSVSRGTYTAYFSSSNLRSIKEVDEQRQIAEIALANAFLRENVEQRYWSIVKEAIDTVTGKKNDLVFSVDLIEKKITERLPQRHDTDGFEKIEGLFDRDLGMATEARAKRANLRPDFIFENFAVSSSNQMAWAAASAVAKSPGNTYNPLFFYGGVGVGKTHLMQAIGHTILDKEPEARIIYCAGEEFTNEVVESIRTNTTQKLKEKYRTVRGLLLDDIQFIAGKEKVQEEFFHTFNVILRNGGQVVLTSDRTPQEIDKIDDRLRTRFEAGLVIDVPQPDLELRAAILIIKARQKKLDLPDHLAPMVAEVIEHPRQLEGFLVRLQNEITVNPRVIDQELVSQLLGKQVKEVGINRILSPQDVIGIIAEYFEVTVGQMKGNRRSQPLALQRQILMFVLKHELRLPLTEIGRILGDRDHTTVMHGIDKIQNSTLANPQIQKDVGAIRKILYGKAGS